MNEEVHERTLQGRVALEMSDPPIEDTKFSS